MGAHFLQELSESGDWKSGETYSFPVDAETVEELFMVVSIGEESAVIDLMEYVGVLREKLYPLSVHIYGYAAAVKDYLRTHISEIRLQLLLRNIRLVHCGAYFADIRRIVFRSFRLCGNHLRNILSSSVQPGH